MMHPLAAVGALVLSWLVYKAVVWLRWLSALAPLPKPKGHWVKGQMAALATPRPHATMLAWNQELGGLYHIRVLWMHVVVVSDPALVHLLLKRGGSADKSRKAYGNLDKVLGGPSLLSASSTSPYWRAVRKGIAPAFNMRYLRAGFQHVQAGGAELVALLQELGPEAVVDMDILLQRLSLDVIGRVGFGFDFGSLKQRARRGGADANAAAGVAYSGEGGGGDDDDDMLHTVSLAMQEITKRSTNPMRALAAYLPGQAGAEVRASERVWRAFNARMRHLLRTVKARGPPSPDDVSIAAHLLRVEDPVTGGPLSDARLLPEIATLFVGGIDTTGHTMAWTLYLVSQHPEVEARLCEELEAAGLLATGGSPTPRQVTFEDVSRLPYLTAVVKESMRMRPVGANGTTVSLPHAVELQGHRIPARTSFWLPMYSAHNGGQYWDHPDRFDPGRFLAPGAEYYGGSEQQGSGGEAAGGGQAPGTRPLRFFPFSQGTRDCVGQNLARINYTASLAALWGRFSFRPAGESADPGGVRDVVLLTLQPEDGLKMVAIPRVTPSA